MRHLSPAHVVTGQMNDGNSSPMLTTLRMAHSLLCQQDWLFCAAQVRYRTCSPKCQNLGKTKGYTVTLVAIYLMDAFEEYISLTLLLFIIENRFFFHIAHPNHSFPSLLSFYYAHLPLSQILSSMSYTVWLARNLILDSSES